jgi:hypothetical protein
MRPVLATQAVTFPDCGELFLPDRAEEFAPDKVLPGLPIGHQPFGSGQYCNSHTVHDPWDFIVADVHAASGFADPLDAGDTALSSVVVFQMNAEDSLLVIPDQLEVLDVAFFFEYSSDTGFHPGSRDVDLVKTGLLPVPYTIEKISNRVRYGHKTRSFIYPNGYQLALITPGSSPFRAMFRKQIRQIPNFLMNALGRPQSGQRL